MGSRSLLPGIFSTQGWNPCHGHGTTDWFQIGKGVRQGCILSPYLFNFYAEYAPSVTAPRQQRSPHPGAEGASPLPPRSPPLPALPHDPGIEPVSPALAGRFSTTELPAKCLENPRDGGAWWAAVHGVAQSRTRLKQLSSSSSRDVGVPGGSVVQNPPANAGDTGSIPRSGRSPGGGHGNPLQYSYLGRLSPGIYDLLKPIGRAHCYLHSVGEKT